MGQDKEFLDDRALHLVTRSTEDVLEQAEALPFWMQDYTQLNKGAFSGAINSLSRNGLQIFRESMNRAVDEHAHPPANTYVIGVASIVDSESSWGMLPLREKSLITLNSNSELLFRTSNYSEITAAVISAQRFEDYADQVEAVDLQKLMENVKPVELISSETTSRIVTALSDGLRYITEANQEDSLRMWRHFEDELLAVCMNALMEVKEPSGRHYDHRIHRYIVNRVRDVVLSNVNEQLTISEICTDLHISRRTLNHAFAKVLGVTPVTYIRNVRLHRIRAELQSTPLNVTSIASVASKWGFWHMSLFSRYYRELFGECPIDTLRRAVEGLKYP